MTEIKIDISIKCRACLSEETEMYDLFNNMSESEDNLTLAKVLENTTCVKINKNDGLSIYMCKKCAELIVDFQNFKFMFIENERYLKSLLPNNDIQLEFDHTRAIISSPNSNHGEDNIKYELIEPDIEIKPKLYDEQIIFQADRTPTVHTGVLNMDPSKIQQLKDKLTKMKDESTTNENMDINNDAECDNKTDNVPTTVPSISRNSNAKTSNSSQIQANKNVKKIQRKKKTSIEERRQKEREKKKKQMDRIREDPELHEKYKEKERERYKQRKEKGKLKSIVDLPLKKQKQLRKRWVENARRRQNKKKQKDELEVFMRQCTPPSTPPQPDEKPVRTRPRRKRVTPSCRYKTYEATINGLNRSLKESNKRYERYKKRFSRLSKTKSTMSLKSPTQNSCRL